MQAEALTQQSVRHPVIDGPWYRLMSLLRRTVTRDTEIAAWQGVYDPVSRVVRRGVLFAPSRGVRRVLTLGEEVRGGK